MKSDTHKNTPSSKREKKKNLKNDGLCCRKGRRRRGAHARVVRCALACIYPSRAMRFARLFFVVLEESFFLTSSVDVRV